MTDPTPVELTGGTSTSGTVTVSFTAQTAGTILILGVAADNYRTTSGSGRPESTSWTFIDGLEGNLGFYVWYKVSVGSETSVQYTTSSSGNSAYTLVALDQIASSSFLGVEANNQSSVFTNLTNWTTASVTPTSGSRWCVVAALGSTGNATSGPYSWAGAYTKLSERYTTTGYRPGLSIGTVIKDGGTATTSTVTFASSTQVNQGMSIVQAFKVASGTAHSASATGTGQTAGSASATELLAASSTGTGLTTGSLAATATLTALASGSGASSGSAAASLTQVATASGSGTTAGSASPGLLIPLSATGSGTTSGSAAATITTGATDHAGSATGTGQTSGSAAASLTASAGATGTGQAGGSAAVALLAAGSASGSTQTTGSAAAISHLAASATGTGSSAGSANAQLQSGLSGSATGTGTSGGSAATIANLAASATGMGQSQGQADALINLTASATGLGSCTGQAAATATLVLAAAGTGTSAGSAAATILGPPPDVLPIITDPGTLSGPWVTGGSFGSPLSGGSLT